MSQLKLAALDADDLKIISAYTQDAVMKIGDLTYRASEKLFVIELNRFVWENKSGFFSRNNERRRSILHFERVTGVRTTGFSRDAKDDVLSLLAIRFEQAADAPAGVVELTCSGGAAIRLDVEYVEARLTDLGAAWDAQSRPAHKN